MTSTPNSGRDTPRGAPGPDRRFLAIPAVDLKGGQCVQLVGGDPDEERVSLPDPTGVARGWRERGFAVLHVVDLDAALGRGSHLDLIARIVRKAPGEIQVGGGIRSDERAHALLEMGVDRIIVGTRAVSDPEWLAALAARHSGRIVVAADMREGIVLRRGWTESTGLTVESFLGGLDALDLAGVLCTDVGREGKVKGIDREAVGAILDASPHPVWISGGVTTREELLFLEERGAAGAVLGMALYTGKLNADQIAKEFGG